MTYNLAKIQKSKHERLKIFLELFEVFRRYNRATGMVIKWLALSSQALKNESQSWPLDDMTKVAEFIDRKAIEVPEDVYYAFKDAIGSRSKISLHFRQNGGADEERTRSHEHFTKTQSTFLSHSKN